MSKIKELTIEITNFCEENCKYCSSNSVDDMNEAIFLSLDKVKEIIRDNEYERINISGGEPLSHPDFYIIYKYCKEHATDVMVNTNLLTHICYNSNIIDGIYIETNISMLPNVSKVHILKRVEQGKEAKRPEVVYSGNWTGDCAGCDNEVMKPDGSIVKSPCKKDESI